MDERKKILLGDKDILSRKIQDFYVDINLTKDNRKIIPYKYDNVFDLTKFYNKERNECKSFILYGIVDSYVCDCNNLTIKVYETSSGTTPLSVVQTQDIVSTQMPYQNVYGRLKGKYIIDNIPVNYTGYSVFLKLESTDSSINQRIQDNVFEQQLIFTTLTMSSSGEKVVEKLNYGLNEAVTDCNGNVFEANNDFDFFYNKHWVKKNLSVSNLNKFWIGNEETKFCETQQNLIYHGRTVYGVFNTGYFAYGETMEVYEINTSPTGNYEPNIVTNHYIPHVPSNGLCPTADTYSFTFDRVFSAAPGNSIWTASIIWPYENAVSIYPLNPDPNGWPLYETQLMKTEPVSGINVYNSYINSLWEFLYFRYKNGAQFSGDTFNFNISQNTTIEGVYQEICPWTLNVNPIFINPNLFPEPTVPYSSGTGTYVNQKTKFFNNEMARLIISQPYYYIEDFSITGSSLTQNNYIPSNYIAFNLTMTEDTYVDLYYKKFLTLDVLTEVSYTAIVPGTFNPVEYDVTHHPTDSPGKVDITFNHYDYIPSIQQIPPQASANNIVSGSIAHVYHNANIHIVPGQHPANPTVGTLYGNVFGVWVSGTLYHYSEEMPGTWQMSASTTGATFVYSTPPNSTYINSLYFKMTGDTAVKTGWVFTPSTYSPY